MDIKQLEYFLVMAEEGNMTKAAKRLFMSQPPLSNHLKSMEEELGVELFERDSRKMKLTKAGVLLQKKASEIVGLMRETTRELADYSSGIGGTLTIGTSSSLFHMLFEGNRMKAFCRRYPNIGFAIWEGNAQEIVNKLIDDTIEIAIIRIPTEGKNLEHLGLNIYDFEYLVYQTEKMVAVLHESQDCFAGRNEIDLAELDGKPVVIIRIFEDLITGAFYANDINLKLYCICNDSRNAILWPQNGLGIAITTEDVTDWGRYPELVRKTIREPMFDTQQIVLWRKGKYISTGARNFLELFR